MSVLIPIRTTAVLMPIAPTTLEIMNALAWRATPVMGLCAKMLMSVPMQVHVVQMQIAAIMMEATFVIV